MLQIKYPNWIPPTHVTAMLANGWGKHLISSKKESREQVQFTSHQLPKWAKDHGWSTTCYCQSQMSLCGVIWSWRSRMSSEPSPWWLMLPTLLTISPGRTCLTQSNSSPAVQAWGPQSICDPHSSFENTRICFLLIIWMGFLINNNWSIGCCDVSALHVKVTVICFLCSPRCLYLFCHGPNSKPNPLLMLANQFNPAKCPSSLTPIRNKIQK